MHCLAPIVRLLLGSYIVSYSPFVPKSCELNCIIVVSSFTFDHYKRVVSNLFCFNSPVLYEEISLCDYLTCYKSIFLSKGIYNKILALNMLTQVIRQTKKKGELSF